ncbi:MAG: hypothetical protein ABR571_09215, partial [Jatrophihabitans sp.]|uniref:hypothetical protein n=1 Tax=Jatrophihabitans sp. TaxID=1932789 RepID=UPI00390F752F
MCATFATAVIEPAAHAAPPSSADADVQAIWNGLDSLQSFSQGLATDGAFGQALHDVELTPGGNDGIGFADLFQKAFADRLSAANPLHLSDLVNALKTSAPVDLESNGRSASISATSSTSGTVESLAFDLTVNRRVASAPMTLAISSPKFNFTAPVQVDLALHASFTVAYDSTTGGVYFDTTGSAPAFTLAADAHFPCATASAPPCTQDTSAVHAGVGILGVSLSSGSSFDLTTNLRASLRDPNGDGRVYLGTVSSATFYPFAEPNGSSTTPGELSGGAASAAGMVAVSYGAAPGSLVAQLNLAASVDPSLTTVTLPGVSANVAIVWPDITTGSPTATVTGAGLSSINAFENLSPQDLAQGLAGLATALEGIQMSRTYTPTDSGKTGTTAAIAEGAVTSTYTPTHGGAPEVGDLLRVGGTGAPVRDVVTVDGTSSPFTVTFGSPLNAAVADGTTLTQVDSKGNIDLPFMKGTLADIFQANEAITGFLAKHVTQTYNALANANSGTLSGATAQTASYTVVDGAAPQNGEYYRIGSVTKKVTAVSGTGPYALTFDTPFASAPSNGTAAVQVQLGDLVPNFTSLQSMLVALKTTVGLPGGSTFTVGDVSYDNTHSKLTVGLSIARAAGAAQDLDAFQKVDSGTVSAVDTDPATGAPTLKDNGRSWQANVYAGHRVRSGSSSNIVKSNTGDTLVFIGAWHGAAPAAGDAYDIGGQDSQTGAISFANKLNTLSGATGSGILNANAQIPLATVTPSYSVNLTLALDLQATQTGAGCNGMLFNGVVNTHDCPFTANNPDGTSTVVQSLPTVADRIMLRTADSSGPLHLLTADAPIDSAVEVNATVGFLGLQLKGELHECSHFDSGGACPDPASADHHLLSVDFKSGLGDAQHDLSLSKVFAILASDPASLAGVSVTGQVQASITPHITGIPGLSDSDFFGVAPTFTLAMSDITDPSSVTFDTGGFGTALDKIKAFNFDTSNPKALFGEVLQNLKTLSKLLKTLGDNGNSTIQSVLGTKIPVVGLRLGDIFNASEQGQGANVSFTDTTLTDTDAHFTDSLLLRSVVAGTSTGVVTATTATTLTVRSWQGGTPAPGAQYQVENALDSAIDLLTANPADSLQQLIALVNERLGALSVPITISVDTSGATPILGLQVDWKRDFYFTTPVAFDFKLGSDDNSIVGSQAKGLVELHAKAEAKLKLLLPLGKSDEAGATDPSGLQVDPTETSLAASIDAGASGYLKANFGPLAIALGQPVDTGATHPAEAHATFSASLGSDDTAPESISAFLTGLKSAGLQFNHATPAVTCGGDSTPDLALCAAFPVYLSTDGGTTYKAVNGTTDADPPDTLRLRLPLSGSLSDEFKLTDGSGAILPVDPSAPTVKRLDIPADLLTDLKNAVLDFSQLGGGLDGYFQFAEQALNLASFGGKLPIVGKDLQEGAQFLEHVQGEVDAVLGDLASVSDEQGLKDWINTKLNDALKDVLPSGSKVTADFVCSATLATPAGVATVIAKTTAPTTAYKYRVSATDPKGETVASAAVTATSSALSSTNTVKVTWTKVTGAAAYKVYRSSDGGTTWKKFDAAQADSPSFTDVGDAGTTATPKDSGTNPPLEPCPLTSISGVTLAADIGQGDISADQGCADNGANKCITASTPLNIGVPGLSLAAATQDDGTPDPDQALSVKLGWKIHLKMGLDLHRGFFVETQDSKDPEIALGVAISLPKAIQANISFLKINLCDFNSDQTYGAGKSCPFTPIVPTDVHRTAGAAKPLFAGEFGLDLHTPTATKTAFSSPAFTVNDDAANDITLANLTNLAGLKKLVTVGLSAKVHIDWDFQALADAALPGVGGEFKLDWQWGSTLGAPTVATDTGKDAAPPVDSSNAPDISFNNVYISAGGFLSGVLRPIIKEVQQFTSPLKPVIDTLYAPIPVLSDLSHLAGGGDVTLISIAEAFSTLAGGPDLTMVERILQVIKMVNSIPDGDANLGIFIGSFHLNATKAINTTATPDNTDALIDPAKKTPAPPSQNGGKTAAGAMDDASGGKVADAKAKGGFSFPLLDNPSSVFNLLMGGDVDLIRFDSGNLKLGFAYSQQFGPVYAPPPVVITISGSASVSARIIAGFDTYGLRKAYEAIKSGQGASSVIGSILDSLFLYTVDPTKDDGVPVPVLTLQGELAAGASVTVLIVSVGIEGGIRLTINFYWNDPNNDGKFRSSEFLKTALRNPLCLFNVDGQLSVFLRLNVTIGFGPFSHTFSFTLVDVVLLDFSVHPNCSPPPPELGEVQDHVLYLFFGALGKSAQRGDPWGNTNEDETIKVHELHDGDGAFTGFGVDGLSRHEEFLDNTITTVVLDARGYAGKEKLFITGDSNQSQPVSAGPPTTNPFDKTAVVYGGTDSDNIKIDGGSAYVDGGAGDDTINLSGDGTSAVAGGPGSDNITVGNGADYVAGDSSLPVTGSVTLANHRQVGDPAPQGSWSDVADVPDATGNPGAGEAADDGNDSVLAGYGANHIYGNGGNDSVSIATDKPLVAGETRRPGVNAASANTIVGGTGDNNIHGGAAGDTIYAGQQWGATSDQPNYGGIAGDGRNQVDTGAGTDTVYGGSNADFVVGHSTSAQVDTFYGGNGNDVLVGGFGTDHLYGGGDADYISGGPATIDAIDPADATLGAWKITPTAPPSGTTVGAKMLVGGDGADHITGAGGGDFIYGDRQEDTCALPTSGPRSTPPAETNSGSPGNDYIVGGSGNNRISGGGGDDTLFAGSGNDLLCGGAGLDQAYGGAGMDTLFGGSDKDLLVAGTGNSSLYGNTGNDNVIAGAGNDWAEGNAGSDTIDGGTGQSVIIGGTSAAAQSDAGDTIFGGTGNNVIFGDNGKVDENAGWPNAGKPFVEPVVAHSYDLGTNAPDNTIYGGNDTITGGSGDVAVYGGVGDDSIVGGTGSDHLEGGPGSDTIYGGTNNDDILGGTSPRAVAGASVDLIPDGSDGSGTDVTPDTLGSVSPVVGNTIYGFLPFGPNPMHADVIVGGNGSITLTGAIDANTGAPVRTVLQYALTTVGGNDTITGGPGPEQIFGGLGDDVVHTGNGENYVEGNP